MPVSTCRADHLVACIEVGLAGPGLDQVQVGRVTRAVTLSLSKGNLHGIEGHTSIAGGVSLGSYIGLVGYRVSLKQD